MRYFITAIGTDSGKTLCSAILTEALQADYWKPIQSGQPTDTEVMQTLVSNERTVFHPAVYTFEQPIAPEAAARAVGVTMHLEELLLPDTENHLIIEGAGGVLVPINEQAFVIDIAKRFGCEVILVSNTYLGSINHTLLTIEALRQRDISLRGIIFNGERNLYAEEVILQYAQVPCLLQIKKEASVDKDTVKRYAERVLRHL
ncbi:dethiobiotin synthase [Eisenibacter elegans]|jgi:dethiobiotin synthetase|uniref:dethiobiotin synthase n=1 Tax=Eisenibacter elegans TaxID=997 RepID=UPI00040FE5B1|nr:dethiobiotin synthase [Eisenibacter elegans]